MKLIFVGVPCVVPMPFSRRYQLVRPLECRWVAADGTEKTIEVPEGFLTDGASIPRAFWSVIGSPYLPEFLTGAIVHDWCCEQGWDVPEMSQLFKLLLLDSNVPADKAKVMRAAVELYKTYY